MIIKLVVKQKEGTGNLPHTPINRITCKTVKPFNFCTLKFVYILHIKNGVNSLFISLLLYVINVTIKL